MRHYFRETPARIRPQGSSFFSFSFYGKVFPIFLSPVGGRNASFLSLLLRAKDRLNEDGNPCPALAVSEHQPDNGVRRDNCSELALQCPSFGAPFSAMKKCVLSVVEGPVAVDTVWPHDFTHLVQVSAKQTVPCQELGEVEVHLTPFSKQPVIHVWNQPGCPPASCFLFPPFLLPLALAVRWASRGPRAGFWW